MNSFIERTIRVRSAWLEAGIGNATSADSREANGERARGEVRIEAPGAGVKVPVAGEPRAGNAEGMRVRKFFAISINGARPSSDTVLLPTRTDGREDRSGFRESCSTPLINESRLRDLMSDVESDSRVRWATRSPPRARSMEPADTGTCRLAIKSAKTTLFM